MPPFSTNEVAKAIGVHPVTLEKWLKQSKLRPPRKLQVGGRVVRLWTKGDVERARKHKQKNYRKGRGRKRQSQKVAKEILPRTSTSEAGNVSKVRNLARVEAVLALNRLLRKEYNRLRRRGQVVISPSEIAESVYRAFEAAAVKGPVSFQERFKLILQQRAEHFCRERSEEEHA